MATPLAIDSKVTLRSGHKLPVLGFGLWQSTAPFESALEALRVGYRHLDSARVYRNEDKTAAAVQQSGVKGVFLTSKLTCKDYARASTSAAVTDSISKAASSNAQWSLYLLHDPCGGRQKRIEAWRELERMQQEGSLKAIGVSNFVSRDSGPEPSRLLTPVSKSEKHLQQLVDDGASVIPDVNQIELHPWCQQKPIVEYCIKHNIVVEAYCPIVRGTKWEDPTLQSVAKSTGRTPAQVLLRWSLQKGYVPIVKSDTPARIKENTQIFDFELSPKDMQALDSLDQGRGGACSWNPVHVD
ncbi:hypothetical protein OIV83_002498 [Microbotryomycetes sp. JL201]|nr:hypothetical protein OIV83_002498 [Microbotryomycetes sp. JL201]